MSAQSATTPTQAIHRLSPQLANQIAAGEVVERPASVVKELLENSLDAGSDQITIELEEGGTKLIRLRDNGEGIQQVDLPLAIASHATSKLLSVEQLAAIDSLGFRGEALASISSIARLTISSQHRHSDKAWQIHSEGRAEDARVEPVAHPVGTTVEVRDLFFNTPARRKFLRTAKTEYRHVADVVKRYALCYPDVAFRLTHNGKSHLQLSRQKSQSDLPGLSRIGKVLNDHFAEQLLPVDYQFQQLHLSGWVMPAGALTAQNQGQYFFINGRFVRDKLVNHALKQALLGDELRDLQPAYILNLSMPFDELDVNVHPAKYEVRFAAARQVHDFLVMAIERALRQDDLFVCQPSAESVQDQAKTEHQAVDFDPDTGEIHENASLKNATPHPATAGSEPHSVHETNAVYRNRYAQRPQSHYATTSSLSSLSPQPKAGETLFSEEAGGNADRFGISSASPASQKREPAQRYSEQLLGKPVATFKQRYLLLEQSEALAVLDRLAIQRLLAAERWYSELQQMQVRTQPQLIPHRLELSPQLLARLMDNLGSWQRLGFDFNPLSETTLLLRELPVVLQQIKVPSLVNVFAQPESLSDNCTLDEMKQLLKPCDFTLETLHSVREMQRYLDSLAQLNREQVQGCITLFDEKQLMAT